jgi:plasmid stabilization system protein ParE
VSYTVVVSIHAEEQLTSAAQYYEQQSDGLGYRFIDEVEKAYDKLKKNPQHYSFISNRLKRFRDVGLNNFPYVMVYEIAGNEVLIHSIFDTRQHPAKRFRK